MDNSDWEDFKEILTRNKYLESDFESAEEDLTNWDRNSIVPIREKITIKRISTKKEKTYQSGSGTSWLDDFERDVQQGVFD